MHRLTRYSLGNQYTSARFIDDKCMEIKNERASRAIQIGTRFLRRIHHVIELIKAKDSQAYCIIKTSTENKITHPSCKNQTNQNHSLIISN